MKKTLLSCLFILLTLTIFAQNNKADSLYAVLKRTGQDTNRINALGELTQLIMVTNPDTAMILTNEALSLSQKLKWKKGQAWSEHRLGRIYARQHNSDQALKHFNTALSIADAMIANGNRAEIWAGKKIKDKTFSQTGIVYYTMADFTQARNYFLKCVEIGKDLGDKQTLGISYSNIANTYLGQAEYPLAIEYYFKGLKYAEEAGDKARVGLILCNLAVVYKEQADYSNALKFFLKGLKITEENGEKAQVGINLNNIAMVYHAQRDFDKALEYYFKALKISEEARDVKQAGITLVNIAATYADKGDPVSAKEYYKKGLDISEKTGDKKVIGITLINLGNLLIKEGNFREAEKFLKKALQIPSETGAQDVEMHLNNSLAELYSKTNRHALALEHYKKYITLRDTMYSQENSKKLIRAEMDHEYEKQKLVTSAKHQKEIEMQKAVGEEKNRKQKVITYSVTAGLVLVLALALFILRSYRQKQRANLIITHQKQEVENQKKVIEEKHKEITDSINYAERIQRSFLATREHLDGFLNEYFILFKPKDIVSGDFYWSANLSNGKFILATADSTGHGVPGAIMSLLNITSLEKAIETETEPAEILNSTRNTIINRLKRDGSTEGGKDGMDCSLCVYDFANNKLTVAAAQNPVWIVRGTETIEIKPSKMPVGKHDKQDIPFTQEETNLLPGDVIYTLTDGFPDQFGGENGKKFMSKKLRELLSGIAQLPMQEQKELLEKTFANWVGAYEQVDDVCIIGVRV